MKTLEVRTERKTQLVNVTAQVRAEVAGVSDQLVTLFIPHTTAGVIVQAAGEAAAEVAADVEAAMERLVAEDWPWRHTSEGDRNPWSHVRSALTASSLTLPLIDGELGLGNLQAIFLCEFDGPRTRTIQLVTH
ncbi:MAG TPA: secondary thiamine-phosphate synthase enzyme YjbQ [Solirubrobacteraceae bacterium]|nr:secondary thiamine-phosphate synthase enzyme YjbQ [Solirubrobacteraceae bacterium]